MSKAKTFKDATEVVERPLLIEHPYEDYSSRGDAKTVVLHIIDREGAIDGRSILGSPEKHHTMITKCNRLVPFWKVSDWREVNTAIRYDGDQNTDYKFCSRCGTKEDFIAVMTEMDARWEANRAADIEKRRKEKQAAEEQWERIKTATRVNGGDLMMFGFNLHTTHDDAVYYTKTVNGRVFRFTIVTTEEEIKQE